MCFGGQGPFWLIANQAKAETRIEILRDPRLHGCLWVVPCHGDTDNKMATLTSMMAFAAMQIVQFMGAHIARGHIILASEFMPRGDLWDALDRDTQRQFSWYKRYGMYTSLMNEAFRPHMTVTSSLDCPMLMSVNSIASLFTWMRVQQPCRSRVMQRS